MSIDINTKLEITLTRDQVKEALTDYLRNNIENLTQEITHMSYQKGERLEGYGLGEHYVPYEEGIKLILE